MTDHTYFKEKLENERALLEKELATVGVKNPSNKEDWVATPEKMDILEADESEVADRMESLEGNAGILNELETHYNEVKEALSRIENGTYGVCSVCGGEIEKERLEANPAAKTCITHLNN